MKHLKGIALILLLMLSTYLQAENIKQSFSSTFGPSSTPYPLVEQATDGWTYFALYRNLATTQTTVPKVFYGEAAICLYTSSNNADDAWLASPEKTGGVGWVSFYYKADDVVTNTAIYPLILRISISENGTDFTEVETVEVNPTEARTFSYYSKVINNPNAVKVKLTAVRPGGSYNSFSVNVDELIIADAATGTPPHITAIDGARSLEGEINQMTPCNLTVKGGGLSGNVTFAVEKTDSPFAFPTASLAGSTITESGYSLPVNFTPVAKGNATDFLKINAPDLPEMVFPLKGAALERSIIEGFNVKGGQYDNSGSQTFEYPTGWQVVYGGTVYAGPDGNPSNAIYILEGDRSLVFRTSLTSPRKAGGVGTISFMYRTYTVSQQIEFFTDISADGTNWTQIDNTMAAGGVYTPYLKILNDATAKYVRIRIDQPTYQQNGILVDEFAITENNQLLPAASANAQTVSTEGAAVNFTIPLTFANIQSAVSLAIDKSQFTLSKTTLTAGEANGTYSLDVTYTPETGTNYMPAVLTVSDGGLYYPVRIALSAYTLEPTLFTNFDGAWGSSNTGNYTTNAGWILTNGSRSASYNSLFNSPGVVNLNTGGSLISPPKSGGVGSIHFFAKSGWNSTFSLFVSDDGATWTSVASNVTANNNAAYEEMEYVVNSATAKYVKLELSASGSNLYVDNFTVTRNGKKIPHVSQVNQPSFITPAGVEKTGYIVLQGTNIDSDVALSFKSGAAFSLHAMTSIPAGDIHNTMAILPVYFQSETGTFFRDTLVVSGDDFSFGRTFPVKGYNLQDLIFQDFNGTWLQSGSYGYYDVSGWEVSNGSEESYNAVSGRASLSLSAGGELLSLPKSGGVGAVSFLYRTSMDIPLKISVYKSLSGEPVAVLDTLVAAASTPAPFEYMFNEAEGMYVKIRNMYTGYGGISIDDLSVTANGKATPTAVASSNLLSLYAYKGETMTGSLEISVNNVENDIRLTLKNGAAFSIDKTGFTPVDGAATETVAVTYTASDQSFVADTLIINSPGLLKPISIVLLGNIREDKLVEDFNQEGWSPNNTDGNYVVDGWFVKNGTRTTNLHEGAGALRLTSHITNNNHGSLTSPAKSGCVSKVEFYYRSEPIKLFMQTSSDGDTWVDQDSIIVNATINNYQHYEAEINVPDAVWFRIQTAPFNTSSYWWAFIDSVAIDAMPYLRLAGTVEEAATTTTAYPVPVQVAGLLNSEATIRMKSGAASAFEPAKTRLLPADVADGTIASFDVIFTGGSAPATGQYVDTVVISNDSFEPLQIPVVVNFTKPWLSLVNTVPATQSVSTLPLTIPVEIKGLLNTNALIVQDDNQHYTLSVTTISPEELEDEANITVTVTLANATKGTYPNEIRITNADIDALVIPFSVTYDPTGIDKIPGNEQVFLSDDGVLNVWGAPAGTDMIVLNVQGQSIFHSTVYSAKEQFKLQLSTGVYVVKVGENVWKIKK